MSESATLSRRNLLAGLCASGLAAACSPGGRTAEDPALRAAAQGQKLARGGLADWTDRVGSVFDAAGFRLRLEGVRPLASEGARPPQVARSSAFLLVFDVLAGGTMPGDLIYPMATPGVGPLDVFLASAATEQYPNRMHAVFN